MGEGEQGPRRLRVLAVMAVVGCATALLAAAAFAATVQSGNLRVTLAGSLSPQRLPRGRPAPASLSLSGAIATVDGSQVPPVRSLTLSLNRHGFFNTTGIPVCRPVRLTSTNTNQALKVCRPALLGRGQVSGEVSLPLQPPFLSGGPLLIFNGGKRGGNQVLVIQVFAYIPAPTTFVTTALVRHGRAELGSRIEVKVPTIAAGQGSLTSFEATFTRGIEASCPAPQPLNHAVYTFAEATLRFAEGSTDTGTVLRKCRVRP